MNNSQCKLQSNEVDENKKISFSIDVGGGKKLGLIDISTEDDNLIASPFFESLEDLRLSGVPDPDELMLLMNEGFKSGPLQGIQEDMCPWKSESGAAISGDRLKLDCFEGDLFEDVRASISRSSEKFNASRGSASRKAGLKNVEGQKRVGNQSQMKRFPVFGGQSTPAQEVWNHRDSEIIKRATIISK